MITREQRPDANGVLDALLPYAAGLFFFIAALIVMYDERHSKGQMPTADAGTLAPVMGVGQSVPPTGHPKLRAICPVAGERGCRKRSEP